MQSYDIHGHHLQEPLTLNSVIMREAGLTVLSNTALTQLKSTPRAEPGHLSPPNELMSPHSPS